MLTVCSRLLLLLGVCLQSNGFTSKQAEKDDGGRKYHPNDILAVQVKPDKPVFLSDPQDGYVIKSRAAVLNCSVIYSNKAYFSCNGEALAKSIKHAEQDQIDADTGALIRRLSVEISREQVEEYFGKFECHCDAWSEQGQVSSNTATVSLGFLNKEFEVPPYSQSVILGKQVELRCHPPKGNPKPRISWLKDHKEIQVDRDTNFLQSADGHLIIVQVSEADIGNYTCVAENLANRRTSQPARIDIFVDGSWSVWSAWSECDAHCGRGNQRRYRVCNNPAPSLKGDYCFGDGEEISSCVSICKVDGSWSSWSAWSTCSPECTNYRMRTCTSPMPSSGGAYCRGRDQISAACTGGMCKSRFLGDSPLHPPATDAESVIEEDLSLLIGLSVALVVFLSVTLLSINLIRRKGRSQSIYNMASLVYRDEFIDKEGSKREETNFSFPGARVFHRSEDKQILKLDFPGSTTSSPFVDKRSNIQVDTWSSGQVAPGTGVPPTLGNPLHSPVVSEHQYDVPFSHLSKPLQPVDVSGYSDIGELRERFESTSEEGEDRPSNWMLEGEDRPANWMLEGPGLTPIMKPSAWSPSERSINSSVSESSLPASSAQQGSLSSSVLPPGIDPDSFTISTVSNTGCKLSLSDWGVSLLIPEGALDPGYTEEVFLAVMREGRDRPNLTSQQTTLSPVVLAGPPRLSFKKPVVISFNHCASLQHGNWEVGVYHCDSLFSDSRESTWVKLVTVSRETASCPIYTHLEFNTCHILTDFLSRFCLVGQSEESCPVVKVLKVCVFGKHLQAALEYLLHISLVEDTQANLEAVARNQEKTGFKLIDKPKSFYFHYQPTTTSGEGGEAKSDLGSDIGLQIGDLTCGWKIKPKRSGQPNKQEYRLKYSWSKPDTSHQSLTLSHTDPSVSVFSMEFALQQYIKPEHGIKFRMSCDINKLVSPLSRSSNCSSLVASSSGCSSLPSNYQAFKLPQKVRQRLCLTFDQQQEWKNLALGLRLDRFLDFYSSRKSPTDCILSLWEAQQTDQAALTDLLNIVRLLGRQEVAASIEKDVGSWV